VCLLPESAAANERRDFEAVYTDNYSSVYGFIFRRLHHKESTEDLTGDLVYSCDKNYDRYDPAKASLKTWIFTIANNKLKNYYRDNKAAISLDDEDNPIELPDKTDMEIAVYLDELRSLLQEALATLPERERTVVNLKYFQKKTSAQIAGQMGITAGNARTILTRALKKLAKIVSDSPRNGGW
jgi:RNA polymerase sigma-70 factor (ECF subfamily)